MTLRKALEEYTTVYMAYRNFANRTRIEYQNDLEGFIEFLEKTGLTMVRELGLPVVERYLARLEQGGYASSTRKRKTISIRSFLSFLYEDGHIANNISKMIVLPFTENATPQILTQIECNRLRLACAGNSRDRAIIELLLQIGIKLSELINLTIDDIDYEEVNHNVSGYIRLIGRRGKKDRFIPLNDRAYQALKRYLLERRMAANKTLFLNRLSEPLGERGVQKMLKGYLQKAGIGRASPQTLRHTFGVYHTSIGVSIKNLQEAMGHKDKRSAMIYTSLTREQIKDMQKNPL